MKVLNHVYSLLIIVISFLIFNSTSISEIINSLKMMFALDNIPFCNNESLYYLRSYAGLLIISTIAATPILKNIASKIRQTKLNKIVNCLEVIIYFILLTLTTAYLIDASFNPFLYFRF